MALAKWQKSWERRASRLHPIQLEDIFFASVNVIFLTIFGWVFMSLISGAVASTSPITGYAEAVFGFVLLLISVIAAFTYVGKRTRIDQQIGLATSTGCLCGGAFIVYGQIWIGGALLLGCFIFFVLYRSLSY